MKTLVLTSPLIKSDSAVAAQKLLSNNQYGHFYTGVKDGEYGPETAHAAYLAHYFLGFSVASCKPVYGDVLKGYLSGKVPLGPLMRSRRTSRLKQAALKPLRVKSLEFAITQIGTKESPPGSNKVKYSDWYGIRGPWCAMFVSYCRVQAGSRLFQKSRFVAYVPNVVADARTLRNGMKVTKNPEPGDLVCYDWDKDGIADHIGFFEAWTNQSKGEFTAIEGNTGSGNDSNGGEVMRRDRTVSNVQVFVSVNE